jgi:hypothetical protein
MSIFEALQDLCFIDKCVLNKKSGTYSLFYDYLRDIIFAANSLPSDFRSAKYTLAVAPLPSYLVILNFY